MVIPRVCAVCGEPLMMHERYICIECLADMPLTHFWESERNEMADKFNGLLTAAAEEPYCCAAALFDYNEASPYRHITPHLKYGGGVDSGRFFGSMLGERLSGCAFAQDVDCIVPVPLHWRRRMTRGYNQAEIIASSLVRYLPGTLHPEMLRRVRYSKSQTMIGVSGKCANVVGAFKAVPSVRYPRHILLVDDVFTTGATLAACHAALRKVYDSSTKISAVTLAYVASSR